MSTKNSNDTIWNRTSDLLICSAVPYLISSSSSSSSSNIEYSILFCLDDHYRNDDELVKQKMGLQNNKVMKKLTITEI
jgi:hypothetical protein